VTREVTGLRRHLTARERMMVELLREYAARDCWLHDRMLELHARVRALDGITPQGVPPWPRIVVPPELIGLLDEEG
jgi:hypothetical protein